MITQAGHLELGQELAAESRSSRLLNDRSLPCELVDHRQEVRPSPDLDVVGGALVWVLAVAELEHLLEGTDDQRREVSRLLRNQWAIAVSYEPCRRTPPRRGSAASSRRGDGPTPEFVEDRVVARRADDRRGKGGVLGRGADHRRPADVDVLDELVVGDAAGRSGPLERIEVDADQVDELDLPAACAASGAPGCRGRRGGRRGASGAGS